ncbi:hypothetical protein GY45DRAFT_1241336 [Cubamyces sp. BRFM 1775]|nr:hypothetical protein GY45DRAFT_1241336 [Cubamyces sp. BRFM 1775]
MADAVFPLTIDDTSPLVQYSPFGDTTTGSPAIGSGWNAFDTSSGFASWPSGSGLQIGPTVSNGTSLHLTAADGAGFQIDWNGASANLHENPVRLARSTAKPGDRATVRLSDRTDITIFGTLVQPSDDVNISYTVLLDGTATTNYISHLSTVPTVDTAANDILASFGGLAAGSHSVQLMLHNLDVNGTPGNSTSGPLLAFDRALVEVSPGKPSGTPTSSPTSSATARTEPVPDDAIAYRGQWDFTPDLLPGRTASFHTSTNVGDRATLSFNGSAVGLTGLTTPASGAYNISLDSEEPVTFSARASFTSSSPTLLYLRTGLDPSVMHLLEVVNAGPSSAAGQDAGAGSLLVLAAINVTTVDSAGGASARGPGSSSGLSKGAIAALAIGITLAVAVAVVIALFLLHRRRRVVRRKREMLVNPRINRAGRLSFLFPSRRASQAPSEQMEQKTPLDQGVAEGGERVLDIRSPNPDTHEKPDETDEEDDGEADGEGEGEGERRFSAAEKGKARAVRKSNASKNSDGSYSIELPDLTIAQVPRGYLPTSIVPSTPSPPRTIPGSLASPIQTSPRSPRPRGPREMQGRDSTRGILLTSIDPGSPVDGGDEAGGLTAGPPYLPDTRISPLRVEFATELPERPDRRQERHVSTATSVSLPASLKQALTRQQQRNSTAQTHLQVQIPVSDIANLTPPEPAFSFLDFDSSTSTSRSRSQRQSSSTGKSRSSSQSKRNTGSEHATQLQNVNWANLAPDRRISLGLSMTVTGGPTGSRPSLPPTVLLQPVPIPPPVPRLPTVSLDDQHSSTTDDTDEPEGPDQPFPFDAGGEPLPSPTDSIPFTVSDIHFRHSTHSSISGIPESRRASAQRLSGSHRLPHPPLPGIASGPSSPTRPTHRRQGSATAGGSQTVPPFIVQRILGRAPGSTPASPFSSPTTPQFASLTGTMGRPAASAPVTPALPPASSPPLAQSGSRSSGGQGNSSSSGSTAATTVFGFQLGRHR